MSISKIKIAPDPLAFIQEGACRFTPAQAAMVYRECRFERQRSEAQSFVNAYAADMRRGSWTEKSPLDFARFPDGAIRLLNGHHRMLAQVEAGVDVVWQVIMHNVADDREARHLYFRFDTMSRKRSSAQVVQGAALDEEMGLPFDFAKAMLSAGYLLANPNSRRQPPAVSMDEKLRLVMPWVPEAKIYADCVEAAQSRLRRRFLTAGTLVVALNTIRYTPAKAITFWAGAAEDDGLRRGDPRKTLLEFWNERNGVRTEWYDSAVAAARCWNAAYAGRELAFVRTGRSVRVGGTPCTVG